MIRVMVVDDQRLMRDGLKTILSLEDQLEVVGTASDGRQAFELAKQLRPDVVLMDIRMPCVDGVTGTRLIREQLPETKVLILTTFSDSELIFEALDEGASGYLLKEMPTEEIVEAIHTVYQGGMMLPPDITAQVVSELKRVREQQAAFALIPDPAKQVVAQPAWIEELTDREREVLRLLGFGLNNREIADRLAITEGTTKNHVSSIISKLHLRDRTQAAIYAIRHGITPLDC
ncbi:response regulator [Tumebacillus permanentifrigoris]|uniref:LuxR family two component transcriptional regulator n=1 Tax=Tumebacillus permanentifrigoris TaxID=378543 RepID=A0A316DE91_9BACL|nr:response regulator transcription factor [Tumebacillus permanentifrigoris]PWK15852.1 LuxR family two component transcriptional regulator [Tumebacillus permanentifrigoris]